MVYNISVRAMDVSIAIGRDPHNHPSTLLPDILRQMAADGPPQPLHSEGSTASTSSAGAPSAGTTKESILGEHPDLAVLWAGHNRDARTLAKAGRAEPVVLAYDILVASVLASPDLSGAEKLVLKSHAGAMYFGLFGKPNEFSTLKALLAYVPERFGHLAWKKSGTGPEVPGMQASAATTVGDDVRLTVTGTVDGLLFMPNSRSRVHTVVEVKNRMYDEMEDRFRVQDTDRVLVYLKTHGPLGAQEGVLVEHTRRGGGGGILTVMSSGGAGCADSLDGAGGRTPDSLRVLQPKDGAAAGRVVLTTYTRQDADLFWEATVVPGLAAFFRVACALAVDGAVREIYEGCEDKAVWYDSAMVA